VRQFDLTPDGKMCEKLKQQKRDAGKAMTNLESALLTALDAQVDALRMARDLAKQGGDSVLINQTKSALDSFNRGKLLGKKRSSLVAKRRKCGNRLTAQQEEALARLVPMRKLLDSARDKALKEQKELREKLIENIHKRRREGKCWYVHMDRLYQMNGVNRESYHMRKFSGRPLKKMKKEAVAIFDGAKQMLRDSSKLEYQIPLSTHYAMRSSQHSWLLMISLMPYYGNSRHFST
jgi:hypothetical protein